MRFTLEITPKDGDPYEAVASFSEIVEAETRWDKPISEILDRYTTTLFLGWSAAHRQGRTDLDFDDWLSTIDGCALRVDPIPPTRPSRSRSK